MATKKKTKKKPAAARRPARPQPGKPRRETAEKRAGRREGIVYSDVRREALALLRKRLG